jgi:hypothetical protein
MMKQSSDVNNRVNSIEKKVDGVRDAIEDLKKLRDTIEDLKNIMMAAAENKK